jgi:hypothetical protein
VAVDFAREGHAAVSEGKRQRVGIWCRESVKYYGTEGINPSPKVIICVFT